MGGKVYQAVLSILNSGTLSQSLNHTFIFLIPKIKSHVLFSDYRPRSLCNVLYKIVSKVIANRIKTILVDIILLNQSAFILGRLISDNIMVAYEALHTIKTRQKRIT